MQSLKENQKQERKQQLWSLPKRILIQSAVCARKNSPQETSCSSTLKKLDMLYTSQCPALRLEPVGPVTTLEERARGESDHLLLSSHGVHYLYCLPILRTFALHFRQQNPCSVFSSFSPRELIHVLATLLNLLDAFYMTNSRWVLRGYT